MLASAGVCFSWAQSSVTIFGNFDGTLSGFSNKSENQKTGSVQTINQNQMRNSGNLTSRLGFRGTEDLGGGLKAGFWLEAGINTDDGSGSAPGNIFQFNRRSTVSLLGDFGEIRLGRDYTPTYATDYLFDPFGTTGSGTSLIFTANGGTTPGQVQVGFPQNTTYTRASNSVSYYLPPKLGGFFGQVMYAFNEKTNYDPSSLTPAPGINLNVGRYVGAGIGYINAPLTVAMAYGQSTVASNFFLGTTNNLDTWNFGGAYDFGFVKLSGEFSHARVKQDAPVKSVSNPQDPIGFRNPGADGWLLAATVPVGAGLIRTSYSAIRYKNTGSPIFDNGLPIGFYPDGKADKLAIGYLYNLSKRTALYATLARVNNRNGADLTVGGPAFMAQSNGATLVPKSSTGYDFGLSHSF